MEASQSLEVPSRNFEFKQSLGQVVAVAGSIADVAIHQRSVHGDLRKLSRFFVNAAQTRFRVMGVHSHLPSKFLGVVLDKFCEQEELYICGKYWWCLVSGYLVYRIEMATALEHLRATGIRSSSNKVWVYPHILRGLQLATYQHARYLPASESCCTDL